MRSKYGCDPLHRARFFSRPTPDRELAIARLLLEAGGDPLAKWGVTGTPMDSATVKVKNLMKKYLP